MCILFSCDICCNIGFVIVICSRYGVFTFEYCFVRFYKVCVLGMFVYLSEVGGQDPF